MKSPRAEKSLFVAFAATCSTIGSPVSGARHSNSQRMRPSLSVCVPARLCCMLQVRLRGFGDHLYPLRGGYGLARRCSGGGTQRQLETAGGELGMPQHDRERVGFPRHVGRRPAFDHQRPRGGVGLVVGMAGRAIRLAEPTGVTRWRAILVPVGRPDCQQGCQPGAGRPVSAPSRGQCCSCPCRTRSRRRARHSSCDARRLRRSGSA